MHDMTEQRACALMKYTKEAEDASTSTAVEKEAKGATTDKGELEEKTTYEFVEKMVRIKTQHSAPPYLFHSKFRFLISLLLFP